MGVLTQATFCIVIKVFLTRVVRWVKMFTGNSGYISTSHLILEGELAAGTFMVIGLTMCCRYQHRITVKADAMVTYIEIFNIACCKLFASKIMDCGKANIRV